METFSPVGSYSIEIDGRLLISTQAGPFNLPYAQDYAIVGARVARALNDTGPYAILTIFHGSMVFSSDALEFLRERTRIDEVLKTNCVAHAIVADDSVQGIEQMRPLIERFFQSRSLDAGRGRFLSDEGEARQWLQDVLNAETGATEQS